MKLVPLGIYGAYPQQGGATSCYLVSGERDTLALDFGSGAMSRLPRFCAPEKLSAVVLSHLHYDHIADIMLFKYYLSLKGCAPVHVYLPETPECIYNAIASCPEFIIHVIKDGMRVAIGEFSLSFLSMLHPVETYGVRIEGDGGCLAYSADTKKTENLAVLARESDLFLCDGAVFKAQEAPNSPHIAVEDGATLAKTLGVKIMFTHLTTSEFSNFHDVIGKMGVEYDIAQEFAEYYILHSGYTTIQ